MRFLGNLLAFFALTLVLPAQVREFNFVPNQYILELKGEPAMRDLTRRTAIRQSHQQLTARLRGNGITTMERTENIANLLFVKVPADGTVTAETLLATNPEVARVYRVQRRKAFLDTAATVHRLTKIWDKIGQQNAGKGIRVAVLDSGIDVDHPSFQVDPAKFPMPDGFPRANVDSDLAYTNNKVIVARSYPLLWDSADPDSSARDHVGHGTAVASCVGAVTNTGPYGTIAGMAPGAYLGSYKVQGSPNYNDYISDAAALKAFDDAVADGMDIINISWGGGFPSLPENDLYYSVAQRLEAAGIVVVAAAGNDGPDPATLSSPGILPTFLTVGASYNGRVFASPLAVSGASTYASIPGEVSPLTGSVAGPLVTSDGAGGALLACTAFPANSLKGKLVLISRGSCTFDTKILNAYNAGATAVVVYNNVDTAPFTMATSLNGTFPAVMISQADGNAIRALLATAPSVDVTLNLSTGPVPSSALKVTDFSSAGPVYGLPIKPDLLAVGADVSMAAQKFDRFGEVYSSTGYIVADGTSFATPITAGSLATIKALRPGLSPADYRSLLVNTAQPLPDPTLSLSQTGAGELQADLAADAELTFNPLSVSVTANSHTVNVKNLTANPVKYTLTASPKRGDAPQLSVTSLALDPNAASSFNLITDVDNLAPGIYEGYINLASDSGKQLRVPYFFGKPGAAASLEYARNTSDTAGATLPDTLFFRVLDANYLSVFTKPTVTVVSGTGQVKDVVRRDDFWAGSWAPILVLGRGRNIFRIDAGNGVTLDVTITGI